MHTSLFFHYPYNCLLWMFVNINQKLVALAVERTHSLGLAFQTSSKLIKGFCHNLLIGTRAIVNKEHMNTRILGAASIRTE